MIEKIIVCDCDGVLTDGKIWVDSTGGVSKGFNTRDIRSIKELISKGYEFHILTASSWHGAKSFCKKVGAELHILRNKEEFKISDPFIYVADDAWDIKILSKASKMFCPEDADLCVRVLPGMEVLKVRGGEGVIAELAKIL